jgi:hypothetical protein
MDEPCRFMGTFHKESRVRLEDLRMCHAISDLEWECMVRVLKALDKEYTAECRDRKVRYRELASQQRERYAGCLPADGAAVAACAVLSDDGECMAERCLQAPAGSSERERSSSVESTRGVAPPASSTEAE